jgi:hypothetical protein
MMHPTGGNTMTRAARLAVLLAWPCLALAADPKGATEPGVQWEQTVEMQMAGFSMPAQTSKVCVPKKGLTEPPGSGRKDDKCKVTNVRNDGKTMRWSMTCQGDEPMTGEGEIVQGPDGYDGKMTMRGAQGEMLMKMKGRKLGGECDAGEVKRQVAAIQAQGAAQVAEACREGAAAASISLFAGPAAICKAPADRAAFCKQAATRDGVLGLSQYPASVTKDLSSLCGKDLDAMKADACADAGRQEAERRCTDGSGSLLSFIGGNCPAQVKVVAQRECAGRTYTDLTTCYRSFCTSYAADLLDKGKKKPAPTPEDAAGDAAKKAVKSLLPF